MYAKPFQAAASMVQPRRHLVQFSLPLFATLFEFKTSKTLRQLLSSTRTRLPSRLTLTSLLVLIIICLHLAIVANELAKDVESAQKKKQQVS
jgi:hypothetical protein